MLMLKQLFFNIPLVEALCQMSGYTKFMKDLVMKIITESFGLIDNMNHYSI